MHVRVILAGLLAAALVTGIDSAARAQNNTMMYGLLGAGIGGAAGGGGGAAVGGMLGMTMGMMEDERQREKDQRQRQVEQQRMQHYQTQRQQIEAQQQQILQLQQQQRQQADEAQMRAIQSELAALGYQPGPVSGLYTRETQRAIENYQYNNRLPVNGLASSDLLRHMQISRERSQDPALKQRVEGIERDLGTLGYRTGPTDGAYTAETRDAIASYQMHHGLRADGAPSADLADHVRETVNDAGPAAGTTYRPGAQQMSDDQLVAEIQVHLAALEYDPGPVDGKMGRQTQIAIMAFESDEGLPASGLPSRGLLQRLEAVRARVEDLASASGTTIDLSDCSAGEIQQTVDGESVTVTADICRQPDGSTITITR